jgi:hypothetical protein
LAVERSAGARRAVTSGSGVFVGCAKRGDGEDAKGRWRRWIVRRELNRGRGSIGVARSRWGHRRGRTLSASSASAHKKTRARGERPGLEGKSEGGRWKGKPLPSVLGGGQARRAREGRPANSNGGGGNRRRGEEKAERAREGEGGALSWLGHDARAQHVRREGGGAAERRWAEEKTAHKNPREAK